MALPAHSGSWFSRGNVFLQDTSTAAKVTGEYFYNLKLFLCDQLTAGNSGGTRSAASIWTVVSSSDGSSAAASDLWGTGAYDSTKIVQAAFSNPHSWIILQNDNLQYQMLIDLNFNGGQYGRISYTTMSAPFNGSGSTTSPVVTSKSWIAGSTSNANSTTALYFADTNANTGHCSHFSINENGEFVYFASRPGTGFFHSLGGFLALTSSSEASGNQYFSLFDQSTTSRGAGKSALQAVTNAMKRVANGNLMSQGGLRGTNSVAGTDYGHGTADWANNGAVHIWDLWHFTVAPQEYRTGKVQDFYAILGSPVGRVYSSVTPVSVVIGNLLVPFTGFVPII